tara:strand:+ start:341 stop:1111 length:771 start_codon:yes stop_codon:yes gene_type:complete
MFIGINGISICRPGKQGASFVPTDISNLAYWYSADSGITKDGSNLVSQWDDRSGNARNVTQATAGNKPVYTVNQVNGLPAIVFDGSNDFMSFGSSIFTNTSNITFFAVAKVTTASQYATLFSQYLTGALNAAAFQVCNNSGALKMQTDVSLPKGMYGSTTIPLSTYKCFTYRVAPWSNVATNTELWLNGVAETETSYGGAGTPVLAAGNVYVGSFGVGGPTVTLNGGIAEIVIYNANLSDSDRGKVESYLIAKYAL